MANSKSGCIIAGVILVGGFLLLAQLGSDRPERAAPLAWDVGSPDVTVDKLLSEFRDNEVRASDAFGKRVQITGAVSVIADGSDDKMTVQMASGGDAITFVLGADQRAKAMTLSRGKSAEIQCESVVKVIGFVSGQGCILP